METPESKHDAPSLRKTVNNAVDAISPFLKEAMDDVVQPVKRVMHGQGDLKDFAIVGAETATVLALAIPGGRGIAKLAEHSTGAKTLEDQWNTASHLPFFDTPKSPPSPELAKAFEKTEPSIGVVGTTHTTGEGDSQQMWFAQAAGFMVDDEGLFLTSHHEIKDKDAVSVFLSRERSYEVKLLGVDKDKDLALLRVVQSRDDDVFHPLKLSDKALKAGDETMAVGVRNGIKVASGRFIGTKETGPTHIFEAKAPGGFSGGPIINADGEAVAMTLQSADSKFQKLPFSAYLTRRFGGERIFAASSDDLRAFVDKYKQQKGIYLQPLDPRLTE